MKLIPSMRIYYVLIFCVSSKVQGYSICVTGASGYLGSEIVLQLLEQGQTVHAICRSSPDHLKQWESIYGNKLKLFPNIDLSSECIEKLSGLMLGCECAIHTAAPFPVSCAGVDVASPTLASMKNILVACKRAGVHRAAITSSIAACRGPRDIPRSGGVFDEEDWNLSSRPDGPGMEPYQRAKADAELAARAFAASEGLEVVSLLPTCLLGPMRGGPESCSGATSVRMLRAWLGIAGNDVGDGGRGARVQSRLVCDVRDAAAAHIFAAAQLDSDVIGRSRFRSPPRTTFRTLVTRQVMSAS